MKMLYVSIAAITMKIFTEFFHDQQENFTGISGKGKERQEWREVCHHFKSEKRPWKETENLVAKSETSYSRCVLLQTYPKESKASILKANVGKSPMIMPIVLLYT